MVVVISVITFAAGPKPLTLPEEATGDRELVRKVREALGPRPGIRAAAVVRVRDGSMQFATLGRVSVDGEHVDPQSSRFEIGSLTKPLTGMLFASMTPEFVSAEANLGSLLEPELLGGSELQDVKLTQLAHHQSGLPRLPLSPEILAGSFVSRIGSLDPYPDWSATRLLAEAASTRLGEEKFQYSNLGAAVLGNSLALASGQPYSDLLKAHILDPLRMTGTTVALSQEELPANRVVGSDEYGRVQAPWVSPGFTPAGVGVWSTVQDLGLLLDAVLDGSAPGIAASQPDTSVESGGISAIGYFWLSSEVNNETILWHDGGTGGFRSWMGFNRDTGTGVAILIAGKNTNLHELGIYLLGAGEPPAAQGRSLPGWYGFGVVFILAFTLWRVLRAMHQARKGHRTDLVGVITMSAEAVGILALSWALGPWTTFPWVLWSIIAALTFTALLPFLWWNRKSEWFGGGIGHAINMVITVALAVLIIVLVF